MSTRARASMRRRWGVLASLVTPCDGKYARPRSRGWRSTVPSRGDDEKTGKALLERGQLRRRVTLIPLNKVRPGAGRRGARARLVAKKAGGRPASLEFVGHEEHVKNAVEYAFGGRSSATRWTSDCGVPYRSPSHDAGGGLTFDFERILIHVAHRSRARSRSTRA